MGKLHYFSLLHKIVKSNLCLLRLLRLKLLKWILARKIRLFLHLFRFYHMFFILWLDLYWSSFKRPNFEETLPLTGISTLLNLLYGRSINHAFIRIWDHEAIESLVKCQIFPYVKCCSFFCTLIQHFQTLNVIYDFRLKLKHVFLQAIPLLIFPYHFHKFAISYGHSAIQLGHLVKQCRFVDVDSLDVVSRLFECAVEMDEEWHEAIFLVDDWQNYGLLNILNRR